MMFHIQPWMILSLLPLSTAFEGNVQQVDASNVTDFWL